MSIDLQGWYISKTVQSNIHRVAYDKQLDVIGANHGEGALGLNFWDADETHTFMQQVELVIQRLARGGWDKEDLDQFRKDAEDFQKRAEGLGKPIRSYWL